MKHLSRSKSFFNLSLYRKGRSDITIKINEEAEICDWNHHLAILLTVALPDGLEL